MNIAKELMKAVTVEQVKIQLAKHAEFDPEYLNGDCFAQQVEYRANDFGMSVNQIVADFKKINGVK